MSMISEQIEELRLMAEMFVNGEPYGNLLRRAANTIEMLSEKAREPNNSGKPNNCEPKICDICRYYNSNIPCGSTPSACKEADKFAEEFVDGLKKLKPKDEPTTQMKTQNSNLTFEKDECAKEYEELGLKELKELIKADRKDEPHIVGKHADVIIIDEPWYKEEPKDEPTISKMEQVDKDINVRSKWETPPKFEHKGIATTCVGVPACLLEIEDEPQIYKINPQEPTNMPKCFDCEDFFTCDGQCDEVEDEPQMNLLVKTPRKSRESHEIADAPLTDAEITELAKEIVHKMIDNSVIAEDAYPDLRQRMHEAVEQLGEYYSPEDERSE